MATEYGNRLRMARKRAGLTQIELSKRTGIAQSTISTAERGGNGSAETPLYAQVCGVSAIWLAKGEGPMEPATATAALTAPSAYVSASGGPATEATLGQTLERLGQLLDRADEKTRNDVAALDKTRMHLRGVKDVGTLRCVMPNMQADQMRKIMGRTVRAHGSYQSDKQGRPRLMFVERIEHLPATDGLL